MATKKALKKPASKKPVAKKPAPAAAKRMAAKVSPLAGVTFAEYVAKKLSGWQADAVTTIAGIIRAAALTAKEAIEWGQPVFEENGPFAYIKPSKNHLTLGFWRGAELADPRGLLEGDGDRMKHMKLDAAARIDAKVISAFVRDAVALNRAKGNPTKRA